MEFRQITPGFAVAPQIGPEDVPAVSEAGYASIICNRPDDEVPQDLSSYAIAKAAAEAGLTFSYLPVASGPAIAKTVEDVAAALSAARGPVLAYCKSGMRSAAVWVLWRVGMEDTDAILRRPYISATYLNPVLPVMPCSGAVRRVSFGLFSENRVHHILDQKCEHHKSEDFEKSS